MKYFESFSVQPDIDPNIDGLHLRPRPVDAGGDALPFRQLSDRRFEVLVYRLKSADPALADHTATLMQGTRDRGRDVIVYAPDGILSQIAQCKLQQHRMTLPEVRAELVKLALHHYRQPDILGDRRVIYEIWCPSGFAEPAAEFLDTWPAPWTEASVAKDVENAKATYRQLSDVDWNAAKDVVLTDFKQRLSPRKVTDIDISVQVRANTSIYRSFFLGGAFIAPEDFEKLQANMAAAAALSDADSRRVFDRIGRFPKDRRLVFFSTVLLGLSPTLVARLKRDEFTELMHHVLGVTVDLANLIMKVCGRLKDEHVAEFRRCALSCHPALPEVFAALLSSAAVSRLTHMHFSEFAPKHLTDYFIMSLDERLEHHINLFHDNCRLAWAADSTAPDSRDQPPPIGILGLLNGAKSAAEFRSALHADVQIHKHDIRRIYDAWMAQIPHELLIISDSLSMFHDDSIFRRGLETSELLSKLRGSEIIPE